MTSDPIIKCEGLWKRYGTSIASNRRRIARLFLEDLFSLERSWSDASAEKWVLRDINLEVRRGESLGVLGHNGAGKSTLMRIVSRRAIADAGTCETKGDIAVLANLATGFQPDLSGRENIHLYASLRGRRLNESRAHEDEIISFSELGSSIDAPFGSYSMGMKMRLGFSVSTCLKPDVIIIDETLSVGDKQFRLKCQAKLEELKADTAILLASHDTNTVSAFCERAIVIDHGDCIFQGDTQEALDALDAATRTARPKALSANDAAEPEAPTDPVLEYADQAKTHVNVAETNFDPKSSIADTIRVSTNLELKKNVEKVEISLLILDSDNKPVSAIYPKQVFLNASAGSLKANATLEDLRLSPGDYQIVAKYQFDDDLVFRADKTIFTLHSTSGGGAWGSVRIAAKWDHPDEALPGTTS
jgi:ABC-type polysaccharide/polyol phosphate transport system ATPase subunit